MAEIIARWEWRCFGMELEAAGTEIRSRGGEPFTRQSSEIYVASRLRDDNTKIRDELMDIKTLQAIDDNKLEQWFPVMKSGFPLPRVELEKVCLAWGVQEPIFDGDAIAYGQLIDNFVARHDELRAVPVTKLRHGFKIDEAIVEIAELTIDGKPVDTICVEHHDAALVWRVVGELGLHDRENVNYLEAIKRTVGWRG